MVRFRSLVLCYGPQVAAAGPGQAFQGLPALMPTLNITRKRHNWAARTTNERWTVSITPLSAIRVINGCMLPSWKRKYYLISFMSVRTWLNKQPKSYLRCYTKLGHNLYYTITTIRNHNHKQHSLITTSVFEYEYLFESN